MKCIISVIVPIYNKAKYIAACLEGALSQTLADIEVICVDDGSTDGSGSIAGEFAKKDSRVKLISQPNLGAGAARNAGIRAAKGEYIAFLDADDFYPSNDTLARIYAAAKANNADICGGSFCIKDGDKFITRFCGEMSGNTFGKEGFINFRDYQFDYAYYRFIYRREFLAARSLYFPDYRRYQDPPFMLRAFDAAGRFYAVPDVTYCYRLNHRPVNWTTEKVLDLLCGIEDNLIFSAEKGYGRVHALNYYRLNNDFCGDITGTAMRRDGEGKILKKLIEVQSAINDGMVRSSGLFAAEECGLCKPLSYLIQSLSAQSARLHSEGWFINKKLFRVYTWPVRMLGKALRDIKHRK